MAKVTDRQALQSWEEYRLNLSRSTTININESEQDKAKRIARLEANPEEWFAYYFPNYYKSKAAKFHLKATKRLLNNKRHYEVRAWSRELAKSARSMFEILYLALTKEIRNVLLVSNSYDNAERLLTPFRLNLEGNNRIINDYGTQMLPGHWEAGEFTTRGGCSFRALGAGQSPRGTRNEDMRVDFILIDDIDTDEECRNSKIINQKWEWIEQALMPTVSISGSYRILFNGNIIAKDCCITRAIEKATYVDIINIRDKNGKSVWPEKNSEEDIDTFLNRLSYISAQKEFYNNPITKGTIFKEMRWDVVPPLNKFRFLIAYGDPAPSNRENKGNSFKFCGLIGMLDAKLYVITCFLDHATNDTFLEWFYSIKEYVCEKTQVYNYIENNSLQDPFYEQVLKPLLLEKGRVKGTYINVIPDERKKPDKFARIEGNLEPLNSQSRLILNAAEKGNPNMQRLEEQFLAVDPQLNAHADGPDGVEGGYWVVNSKIAAAEPPSHGNKRHNSKRY